MLRSRCLPCLKTPCSCGGAPARTRLASGPSRRPAAGSRAAAASGAPTASGAATARPLPASREAQGRNDPPRLLGACPAAHHGSCPPRELPATGAARHPPGSRRPRPLVRSRAVGAGRWRAGSYREALPGTASCSAPQKGAPPLPVQAAKMVGLARRSAERGSARRVGRARASAFGTACRFPSRAAGREPGLS